LTAKIICSSYISSKDLEQYGDFFYVYNHESVRKILNKGVDSNNENISLLHYWKIIFLSSLARREQYVHGTREPRSQEKAEMVAWIIP
jgi:hypothetical protein